jgi:dTDP-4-dehydrorhamnose reductase
MIWITGKDGMLAKVLAARLAARMIPFYASNRSQCNLCKLEEVERVYQQVKPKYILHCASFTRVDMAKDQQLYALADNALAVRNIRLVCQKSATKIIFFSSDYVFDGAKTTPYTEGDLPNPLNFYGYTKHLAENILARDQSTLIIRLSWLYNQEKGFVPTLLQLAHQDELSIIDKEIGSPSYAPLLAEAILHLALSAATGIYHCASSGEVSRFDLASTLFTRAKQQGIINKAPKLIALSPRAYRDKYPATALRPAYSPLCSSKLQAYLQIDTLGTWQDHLNAFLQEYTATDIL